MTPSEFFSLIKNGYKICSVGNDVVYVNFKPFSLRNLSKVQMRKFSLIYEKGDSLSKFSCKLPVYYNVYASK